MSTRRILYLTLAGGALLLAMVAVPFMWDRFAESRRLAAQDRAAAARAHFQRHALGPCPPGHPASDAGLLRRLGVEPSKVRFAAVVLPVDNAEYAIAVDGDGAGDNVRVARLRRSYFVMPDASESHETDAASHSPTITSRRPLDPALIDRLEREWHAAVTEVHPQAEAGWRGVMPDEVTYAFFTPQGCAQVWRPEPSTRRGQMSDLAERLARGDDGAKIAQALDALVQAPPPDGYVVPIR